MPKALPVACFYAALFLFTFHDADEDLWGRLAVGRLVAETGSVPRHDVFAYVPTKKLWVDHEWLSGVAFYHVRRTAGDSGLLLLRAIVGVAAVMLAYAAAKREGAPDYAVTLVALAVSPLLIQGHVSAVRAQSFSFLFFCCSFWLAGRRGPSAFLLLPMFALWANLHGGFAAGLLLVAVLRPRLSVLAAGVTLLNPYGVAYWRYLAGALAMPRPDIAEWQPGYADLHVQLGAAIVVGAALVGRRGLDRRGAAVLVGTLAVTLLHVRFAPFLGLSAVALSPLCVEAAFSRLRAWMAVAFMGLLQASALLGLFLGLSSRALDLDIAVPPERYPVEAVDRLEASGATGAIAVYFDWGEYVLYRLHPNLRVSIDGRYETVYADDIVEMNWALTRGESGRLLTDYPPDFALYPSASGAVRLLDRARGFRRLRGDANAVLYEAVEESQVIR